MPPNQDLHAMWFSSAQSRARASAVLRMRSAAQSHPPARPSACARRAGPMTRPIRRPAAWTWTSAAWPARAARTRCAPTRPATTCASVGPATPATRKSDASVSVVFLQCCGPCIGSGYGSPYFVWRRLRLLLLIYKKINTGSLINLYITFSLIEKYWYRYRNKHNFC